MRRTLFFMVCLLVGWASVQMAVATQFTAQGQVISKEDNTPLAGVTIVSRKGTPTTTTDTQGRFSITVDSATLLDFKYVGYTTKTLRINNGKALLVSLSKSESKSKSTSAKVAKEETFELVDFYDIHTDEDDMSQGSAGIYFYNEQELPEEKESYSHFESNPFLSPLTKPLSTFSVDVDAASYTNVRRMINKGEQVPADAVRSEEFINFFKYNYPAPTGDDVVSITAEVNQCPWNKDNRLVHIGLRAKDAQMENLPASNLVFLIDVSGSMSDDNKLPLVKSSLNLLVNQLRAQDMVSIVTYAGSARVALSPTAADEKTKIMTVINNLSASGSTAGADGIKTAYDLAAENFIKDGNNRIMMFTDGDFNVGQSSDRDMEKLIEQKRATGVFLSVLGYSMGNYKDSKMQTLSQKGNGNASYIDNMDEARRVLGNEFAGTVFTLAKDVKLQVEFNPRFVHGYRLIGYESRMLKAKDFNNDTKNAGQMGVGHTVTALYEIIPVGVRSNVMPSVDTLRYQKREAKPTSLTNSPELLTVKMRYKKPDSDHSQLFEKVLVDHKEQLGSASADFRFSAAVAAYAMLLTKSPLANGFTTEQLLELAQNARGDDPDGYRAEFIRLVKTQAQLSN